MEQIALDLEETLRVRRGTAPDPIKLLRRPTERLGHSVLPRGGHGPMEDLLEDADSGAELLTTALASGQQAGHHVPRAGRHPGHQDARAFHPSRLPPHGLHQ